MKKEIIITKECFEELLKIVNRISENVGDERVMWIEHLKGYLNAIDLSNQK